MTLPISTISGAVTALRPCVKLETNRDSLKPHDSPIRAWLLAPLHR